MNRYARTLGWQTVQPTKDGEMEPVPQPNLIKDALYYLDKDVATNEKYITQARGQLSGVVTTVMALTGKTFEEAVAFIAPFLPEKVVRACIPDPWWNEFAKNGCYSHGMDKIGVLRTTQYKEKALGASDGTAILP